jgi:hypothetical protein
VGCLYAESLAALGKPLAFSPTWMLLSGVCMAVLARLDIGVMLMSYMEQRAQRSMAQVRLLAVSRFVACAHGAPMEAVPLPPPVLLPGIP